PPVIQPHVEINKPETTQNFADGREQLDLDHYRGRAECIDVALVELPEPSARGAVGPPDRLNLVTLEECRQLALVFGDDPGQRHCEVIAKGKIRFARLFVLAS